MQPKYRVGSYYCIVRLIAESKGISAIEEHIHEITEELAERNKYRAELAEKLEENAKLEESKQDSEAFAFPFRQHWWELWKWRIEKISCSTPSAENKSEHKQNQSLEQNEPVMDLDKSIRLLYAKKLKHITKTAEVYSSAHPEVEKLLKALKALNQTALRYLAFHACYLHEKHRLTSNAESAPIISALIEKSIVRIPEGSYNDFPESCYSGVCSQLKKIYKKAGEPDKDALKNVFSFLIDNKEYFPILSSNWKKSISNKYSPKEG